MELKGRDVINHLKKEANIEFMKEENVSYGD